MKTRLRILLVVTLYVLCAGLPASARSAANITGTFFQPTKAMETWDNTTWNELFDTYARLGLDEIIVQWIDYRDAYEYCPKGSVCGYDPVVIRKILANAEARNMRVTVGSVFLSSFWERVKAKPYLVEVHLMRIREATRRAMGRIAPILRSSPAFNGWYLSQEIDDRTWIDPGFKKLLITFLNEIRSDFDAMVPGRPIAISTFSNAWSSPEKLAVFWHDVAQESGLNRILFQDSVGAKKLRADEVPLYLEALQEGLRGTGCDVQPVLEVFALKDGPGFSAVPAPAARVKQQLELEAPYAPHGIVLFSVAEYMSPLGGEKAEALLDSVLSWQ